MLELQIVLQAITEEANTKIPNSIREVYNSTKNRQETLEKYGRDVFLDPKRLKFPVKDPNGKYHCALIYAAYMRGKMNAQRSAKGRLKNDLGGGYYERMGKRAKELFSKCNCADKLNIKLNQEDIGILDFIQFMDLLEIDETMLSDEIDIDI